MAGIGGRLMLGREVLRVGSRAWRAGASRGLVVAPGVWKARAVEGPRVGVAERGLFTSLNPFSSCAETDVPAKKHVERRIVNFPVEHVYEVVRNVNEYKDFVPWCTDSRVVRSDGTTHFDADLGVGFKMVAEKYTSHVTVDPLKSVRAEVDSNTLFNFLVNEWSFKQGPREGTTWLEFFIAFQFKNHMYQGLSSLFFDQVATKMVEAFEQRCVQKYSKTQHYA